MQVEDCMKGQGVENHCLADARQVITIVERAQPSLNQEGNCRHLPGRLEHWPSGRMDVKGPVACQAGVTTNKVLESECCLVAINKPHQMLEGQPRRHNTAPDPHKFADHSEGSLILLVHHSVTYPH